MTKLRDPLSVHQVVLDVAEAIGWTGAAQACGREERHLRKWSEPDHPTRLPLEAALQLDVAFLAAGGTIAPFQSWYETQLQLARVRASHAIACADHLAEAARETGEAIAANVIAAGAGAGPRERRIAVRETEEAIAALAHTLHHLREIG